VLAVAAATVLVYMLALWAISVPLGDPSFVDAGWAFGFVLIAVVTAAIADGDPTRKVLIVATTAVWGLRLAGYLFWRWRRTGPDKRYASMLRHAPGNPHVFLLTRVFLLQGALMWVVALPVQLGQVYATPKGVTVQAVIGLVVAATGIAFEATGDAQLTRFKRDPANATRVMDRGLWRYTRHPNYFGDCLVWWGLFLMAVVNAPTFFTVAGPVTMTYLLLRWSGVPILERGLLRRRPDYAAYMQRTSAFLPRRPRAGRLP
jgi:steroid 5-alpha reductase family enzyme